MSRSSNDKTMKRRGASTGGRTRVAEIRTETAGYLASLRAARAAKRRPPVSGDPEGNDLPAEPSIDSPETIDAAPSDTPESAPTRTRVYERWQPTGTSERATARDAIERRRREALERRAAIRSLLDRRADARRAGLRGEADAGVSAETETRRRPLRRGPTVARDVKAMRTRMGEAVSRLSVVDGTAEDGSLFRRMLEGEDVSPPGAGAPGEEPVQPPPLEMRVVSDDSDAEDRPDDASGSSSSAVSSTGGIRINQAAFAAEPPAPVEPAEAPTLETSVGTLEEEASPAPDDPADPVAEDPPVSDIRDAIRLRSLRYPVPLDALPMIGAGMRMRLIQLGIESIQDLATADPVALKAALGDVSRLANVDAWIEAAGLFIKGGDRRAS